MSKQELIQDRRHPDALAAGGSYELLRGPLEPAYRERVSRLDGSPVESALAFDVGCGTGAVTQTILAQASPREVIGIDPSEGFVAYARDHTHDLRAAFKTGNACSLTVDANPFFASNSVRSRAAFPATRVTCQRCAAGLVLLLMSGR